PQLYGSKTHGKERLLVRTAQGHTDEAARLRNHAEDLAFGADDADAGDRLGRVRRIGHAPAGAVNTSGPVDRAAIATRLGKLPFVGGGATGSDVECAA